MSRAQCVPDVTRTVLQHKGSCSFPEESFVSRNSGPTGPSAKLRFSCKTTALFLPPCFQMAETNLFFVLFSGWRCPSQKLRTHLFWGINKNLSPSSQEPTEDVLPLRSPACLLQEGKQTQMLSYYNAKEFEWSPLLPLCFLNIYWHHMCFWHRDLFFLMCVCCCLSSDSLVCSVHLTTAITTGTNYWPSSYSKRGKHWAASRVSVWVYFTQLK